MRCGSVRTAGAPCRPEDRSRGLLQQRLSGSQATYLGGCAIVLAAHLVFRHPDYRFFHALLAGAIGVLTFVVLLRALRVDRHELPILAWVTLQYYMYWAFPVFYEGKSLPLFPFSVLLHSGAMAASLLGDLVFVSAVVGGTL